MLTCIRITTFIMLISGFWLQALNATPLDDLLQQVRQSNITETKIDNEALTRFKANLSTQKSNVKQQQQRNKALQLHIEKNQASIATNNKQIISTQKLANTERADLNKVFSEFRQASQDLSGQLKRSALSASLAGRSAQLSPLSEASFTPDLVAMKKLWLLFTEQMVASSKVTQQMQQVTMEDGRQASLMTTQIAGFSAFTDQGVLLYQTSNESYQLIGRDSATLGARIDAFTHNEDGFVGALVDPSHGPLLTQATHTVPWWKSFVDAGSVGTIIVIVGLLGMSIALVRLWVLAHAAKAINAQKENIEQIGDNALGRILAVTDKHAQSNADELARFLDEAILAELPEFRRGLGSLAVLATVAPLLGLLGTVAGMIETFHAITAYGNSDPQVLSGGISQALLTTKFGLIAAVPLLLLHSLLSSKSDSILNIIEHQTAGLLARRQQSVKNVDGND